MHFLAVRVMQPVQRWQMVVVLVVVFVVASAVGPISVHLRVLAWNAVRHHLILVFGLRKPLLEVAEILRHTNGLQKVVLAIGSPRLMLFQRRVL